MRPHMVPNAYLLKLLFLARYYLSLNLLAILAISVVLQNDFDKKEIDTSIYPQKTSHKLQSAPIHISMNQGAFYILTDEALTKSLL